MEKTPEGHSIWDNYEGRRRNRLKEINRAEGGSNGTLVDDVADSADDSAYDSDKSILLKRNYECKHCHTTTSRAWRRAPGHPVANANNPIIALCIRCARLWRHYGVIWEEPDEIMRRYNQPKRRIEHELVEDAKLLSKNEMLFLF